MGILRNTWIEVDLDAISHNMSEVKRLAKSDIVCAVIKADGYGHGAVHIAQTLLDAGADRFAVATADEALELRAVFAHIPILVMGEIADDAVPLLAEASIGAAVTSADRAEEFSSILKNREKRGQSSGNKLIVHIKIDTGMGRIGFAVDEKSAEKVAKICQNSEFDVEGIFSHFATADSKDKKIAHSQAKKFIYFNEILMEKGIDIPIKHICNSAGIIDLPEYHFDMVRAGIMLYGLPPSDEVQLEKLELRQAMSLKTKIAFLKEVPKGAGISYGHVYSAKAQNEKIASLAIGYADGLSRSFSQKIDMLIRGRRHPQVGRICMDQTMVRVDSDCMIGDEVVIFGKQQNQFISINELAKALNTINYEIVCMMGKRVPRIYIEGGKN